MKNLVFIMAAFVALTTTIQAGPALAADGNRGSRVEYSPSEYESKLESGILPAMDGQKDDTAAAKKADEKAPTSRVEVDVDRIGIDTL